MNMALRVILVSMASVVILLTVWLVTPSTMFLNPISLTLRGDDLTFVRDTPFGDVAVDWVGEITLLDQDNFECGGSGHRIAQDVEGGIIMAKIGAWAKPCIDAGPPFILRYQFQVKLFGLIPLRPAGISLRVDKGAGG